MTLKHCPLGVLKEIGAPDQKGTCRLLIERPAPQHPFALLRVPAE